jgi:hypothetical protein
VSSVNLVSNAASRVIGHILGLQSVPAGRRVIILRMWATPEVRAASLADECTAVLFHQSDRVAHTGSALTGRTQNTQLCYHLLSDLVAISTPAGL